MTIIPKKGRRRAARAMDTAPDAAIRNVGLRLTGPRRVVLEVVRATDLHPTAELVHRMVRRRLPRVSLGTVYRNLRLLVAEGLVKELPGSHASTATRATTITSRACYAGASLTWMVRSPSLIRALCSRVATQSGFSVTHHRIEFYGRCAGCRRKSSHGAFRVAGVSSR